MSVKDEIRAGTFWLFTFRYAGLFIQVIISTVLARLLSPEEFGIVAVVIVFINFFIMLGDSGIGVAIIQKTDITEEEIFSLFVVTLFISLFLSIAFWSIGGLISSFYGNPEYSRITHLLSISLFFYTANAIPAALLYKNKKFKTAGIIVISIQFVTGIIAIILASLGFSYYSILIRNILISFFIFVVNLIVIKIKLFTKVRFGIVKQIFNYSFYQWLSNIISYFSRNLDNLLIGKYLGVTSLGNYDRAYSLVMVPVGQITRTINSVLHPILAKYQDDKNYLYSLYKKLTKYLTIFALPLSVFLFFAAEEIILILYGPKWYSAIPVFKYLSASIGVQMIYLSAGPIFQVLGDTKNLFYIQIPMVLITLSALSIGIFFFENINTVALLLVFAYILNFLIVYYFLIIKSFDKNILDFFSSLSRGMLIGLIFILVNLIFNHSVNINEGLFINFIMRLILSLIIFSSMIFGMNEYKNIISFFNIKSIIKGENSNF